MSSFNSFLLLIFKIVESHALDPDSMRWLQQMPTMLVGIDVTHPGLGTVKGTPSIAAVVASIDKQYGQYPASMEIQESKKEVRTSCSHLIAIHPFFCQRLMFLGQMVTNLANMMEERLRAFQAFNNKLLPQRVLVYRDGVSEVITIPFSFSYCVISLAHTLPRASSTSFATRNCQPSKRRSGASTPRRSTTRPS